MAYQKKSFSPRSRGAGKSDRRPQGRIQGKPANKNNSRSFGNQRSGGRKDNFRSSFRGASGIIPFDESFKDGFHQVKKFPHLYSDKKGKKVQLLVEATKDTSYFEETRFRREGVLYREIDPSRSKLFASIAKGISQIGIKEDSDILYLGASHGYTVSFLSDMVSEGHIFALDFAPRVLRDLMFITYDRENIAPMYFDANKVDEFKPFLPEQGVDIVFMDVAQKNQMEIFTKNCLAFLNEGGFGLLALKSRSVDVTKKPKDIFKLVRKQLEQEFTVVDYRELDPFETDHALFVVKRKN